MDELCFYPQCLLEERRRYFKLDILAFVQDVLAYMNEQQINILSFVNFNEVWRVHDINLIHQCAVEWECLEDYYNTIYDVIFDQLITSTKHIEKVILFYLLYAIHNTMSQKLLISLNTAIMDQLYFFIRDCREKCDFDVPSLFLVLHQQKAFLLSTRVGPKKLAIHPCGLPYVITKRNKEQLRQITEEKPDQSENEQRQLVTSNLIKFGEDYHKAKYKHNVGMFHTDQHFVQRCIHTLINLNKI